MSIGIHVGKSYSLSCLRVTPEGKHTPVPYVVAALANSRDRQPIRSRDDNVIDPLITSTPYPKKPTPAPRPDLFAPADMPSYMPSCHLHHPLDIHLQFQFGIHRLPQPERLGKGH
jgi:hypothetical protein